MNIIDLDLKELKVLATIYPKFKHYIHFREKQSNKLEDVNILTKIMKLTKKELI